jgi:RNA polymerase sigma factor (sigma-70 family)
MVVTLTRMAASQASDAAVIEASLADPDLFAVLYDRYATQLYRYAHRRLGPESAEDAVAEAFADAFARRRRYDGERVDARPWLFGILTKEIAGHRRREEARYRAMARAPGRDGGQLDRDGLAEQVTANVTAQAVRGALGTALAGLSAGDRNVLLLVAWGDLSYEEVAHALGIPIGTVRSRLNRARRKVRAALGGADPTNVIEETP